MSGPLAAPWSDIGRLQSDIDQLRSQMYNVARTHDVDALSRKVDSMEHSVREISSDIIRLRDKLQEMEEEMLRPEEKGAGQ